MTRQCTSVWIEYGLRAESLRPDSFAQCVVVVLRHRGGAFICHAAPPETPPASPAPVVEAPKPTPTPIDDAEARRHASRAQSRRCAPTPTPEAAPTVGTLTFESDVPDTSVFIDRVYIGTAPVTAHDVKPGSHALRLSAAGYDGIAESIEVVPGTKTLSYKFKEVRLDATIAVVHKHGIGSCAGTLHATPKGLTYETTNKDDGFTVALTDLETFSVDYLQKNLKREDQERQVIELHRQERQRGQALPVPRRSGKGTTETDRQIAGLSLRCHVSPAHHSGRQRQRTASDPDDTDGKFQSFLLRGISRAENVHRRLLSSVGQPHVAPEEGDEFRRA